MKEFKKQIGIFNKLMDEKFEIVGKNRTGYVEVGIYKALARQLIKRFDNQQAIAFSRNGEGFVGIQDACIYTDGMGECFVDFMMLRPDDILFMYLASEDESSNYCLFQLKSGQEVQGRCEQMADVIRSVRGN